MALFNLGTEGAMKLNLLTTFLGGTAGGIGSVLEGRAARRQGAYQAAVLRNNARISNLKADRTLEAGKIAAQKKQLEGAGLIGEQRASFAGRGVDVGGASQQALAADVERATQLDVETLLRNAELEALALRLKGANFEVKAAEAEKAGRDAQIAGAIEGAGTFLTTAGKVSGKWDAFKKAKEEPVLQTTEAEAQRRALRFVDEHDDNALLGN